MWEFLDNLLSQGGLSAVVSFVVLLILWRHTKADEKRQDETLVVFEAQAEKMEKAQDRLVGLYEKRVKDVTESKEDYEELVHNLDKSIDLLIKAFRQKGGGDNGG